MNRTLQVDIERLGTAHQTLVQGLRLSVPAGEIMTLSLIHISEPTRRS